MRIRTIKPSFWTHEALSTLPAETALLAAALLNYADDEGYFNANPKLIVAALFPLRNLSATIPGMLAELSGIGYLELREVDAGRRFGWICTFLKHQRVSKPQKSQLKALFERAKPSASAERASLQEPSATVPGTVCAASATVHGGNGRGREGNKEKEEEGNTPLPPPSRGSGSSRRRRTSKPGSIAPSEQPEPVRSRMLAINALTRRTASTRWDADEREAFNAAGLASLSAEDFDAQLEPLSKYYSASIPREMDFRRRNLLRVMRHWAGELDKARAWVRDNDDGLRRM